MDLFVYEQTRQAFTIREAACTDSCCGPCMMRLENPELPRKCLCGVKFYLYNCWDISQHDFTVCKMYKT